MMLTKERIPITTAEQRDTSHPGFVIVCATCSSVNVFVLNDYRVANDSDGRWDIWGSVYLVCADCNYNIDVMGTGVQY